MVENKEPGMRKLAMVEQMILALGQGDMVLPLDRGAMTRKAEREFQEQRQHWLLWAINNPEGCVKKRIERLEKKLSKEHQGRKYKSMIGIPLDVMEIYAFIEDMEVVLGTHPVLNMSGEEKHFDEPKEDCIEE